MPDTPITLHHGNCLNVLAEMPDLRIDAIVTDPPYELGFMGKAWDCSGIAYNVNLWREALRVLKPGGHLLAFGGTRTYHRMAVAIEDAGFEIRDSIHWLYGSGFPKSLDVSKAIDKAAGAEREVVGTKRGTTADPSTGRSDMPGKAVGVKQTGVDVPITAPATDLARQWEGWGTALKPAHEPIVVARKPFTGTVGANVTEHGTGALNIDGCRVGDGGHLAWSAPRGMGYKGVRGVRGTDGAIATKATAGRWPANVVFTHCADCGDGCTEGCPVAELDRQSGTSTAGAAGRNGSSGFADGYESGDYTVPYGDTGGASRFFTVTEWDVPFQYVPKPSRAERDAGLDGLPERQAQKWNGGGIAAHRAETARPMSNHHPTVKPVDLMRWLVRLVTPLGGTVLDPFAGSGTTLVAARLEGFAAVGIEMTDEYLPIIEGRLAWAAQQAVQLSLFGDEGEAA